MWSYNYTNELYHYGILGMRWGHRKKYQTSSGDLNSLGKARKEYEDAKANRKQTLKEQRKNVGFGFGVKGIAKYQKAQKIYNKSISDEVSSKSKYKAKKSKNSEKAEFNTWRKEMQKSGLAGSYADQSSGGRSTAIYNRLKIEKGKAYADKVAKKVENVAVTKLVASAVVAIGAAAAEAYMITKNG